MRMELEYLAGSELMLMVRPQTEVDLSVLAASLQELRISIAACDVKGLIYRIKSRTNGVLVLDLLVGLATEATMEKPNEQTSGFSSGQFLYKL